MFAGYFVLAIPTGTDLTAKIMMFGALVLIAAGTGMFKGNLQALVGNLYDDPRYSSKRDLAYSIFYMCINVGAFFAPSAAEAISNYFLGKSGLTYDAQIPALAHQYLDNTITAEGLEKFSSIAEAQVAGASADLASFGQMYIEKLSESYNYGFGVACISLILSILVFVIFKKTYNYTDKQAVAKAAATPKTEEKGEKTAPAPGLAVELTKQQVKERMVALFFVFAIVIFFWMSFHQNGLTMTWFARDYTVSSVAGLDRFGFNLWSMLLFIVTFYGIVNLFQAKNAMQSVVSLIVAVVGGARRIPGIFRPSGNHVHYSAEIPAVQPVLHNNPDTGNTGGIFLACQKRQRAFRTTQDRNRHDNRSHRLYGAGIRLNGPAGAERNSRYRRGKQPAGIRKLAYRMLLRAYCG